MGNANLRETEYESCSLFYIRKVENMSTTATEFFGLDVEMKIMDNEFVNYFKWIDSLRIGDIIDVQMQTRDLYSRNKLVGTKWYEAVIRGIDEWDDDVDIGERKCLYVHYIGLNKKYDKDCVVGNFKCIAKRDTMTKGPFRTKRKPHNAYKVYGLK